MLKPLFLHQVAGARKIVEAYRSSTGTFMLGFEMRLGKTRTVIEAAEQLWRAGELSRVLVVAGAQNRGVWCDPELGQLAEYSTVPVRVIEYRSGKPRRWTKEPCGEPEAAERGLDRQDGLNWMVTNYELARRKERLDLLLKWVNGRTLLILDESSAVACNQSAQFKACLALRKRSRAAVLLNGTPEGDTPKDLFAQFYIMDPAIIGCRYLSEYMARYAVMGGYQVMKWVHLPGGGSAKVMTPTEVLRWVNLDDLSRRTAPYIFKKTMAEVFDLPPKLEAVPIEVPLSRETWRVYKDLRDETVAWFGEHTAATAFQAGVRVMRLAQVTSGFVGGVGCVACAATGLSPVGDGERCEVCDGLGTTGIQDIGQEKLEAAREWIVERLRSEPAFKLVTWCRFRHEVERLEQAILGDTRLLKFEVRKLYGQQTRAERDLALRLLHPKTAPVGPADLIGTPHTGAKGQNFAAAATMLYCSNDYSCLERRQADARILGPDQRRPASYFDLVATGPDGQKTVDHAIARVHRDKLRAVELTGSEWRLLLEEE